MTEERFDTVVVGSGFGGSVVAHRLAEQEPRVLVLERGQPYPPGSFARTPREVGQGFWDPKENLHGLFEVWNFSGLDMICASGLGGGSLIYANVMIRKDADSFVREDLDADGREYWPITRQELEPHYDNVEAMQAPQSFPVDVEPYASVGKARAMRDAADELGLEVEEPLLAVLFAPKAGGDPVPGAPVTDASLHGRPRSTCRLCGECNIGCNFGAKNTLDFTYLTAALAQRSEDPHLLRGAHDRAARRRQAGYRVGYEQHLPARRAHPDDLLDPTRGAVAHGARRPRGPRGRRGGSPRLLLANRASLPGLSPSLGTPGVGERGRDRVAQGTPRRTWIPPTGP